MMLLLCLQVVCRGGSTLCARCVMVWVPSLGGSASQAGGALFPNPGFLRCFNQRALPPFWKNTLHYPVWCCLMVPNKNCISTCFVYFSDFCLLLECVGRQTVDLPFCSKPGWFISHKLRGSFLALPASHYLRDFLSLALSIILGCMFLSHDMESVILLSRVQQKWEKEKKPRKWNVLERCISFVSRTQQTVWNLGFSALTWLFLGHSLPALSRGMHGFCRDSASGLLLGKCGENPNSCLSVCWRALSALWSFKSS